MIFELILMMLVFFGTLGIGAIICILDWKWGDRQRRKKKEDED